MLVALNGCQGSGKTTVADFLCASLAAEHSLHTVSLSLDDFYLTRAERETLAISVHPLLQTRGVPGTHDITLLRQTLAQLLDPEPGATVAIPRFDKAVDDRRPACDRDSITTPVDLVLLEGWCLGALPQAPEVLALPVNVLERDEDAAGRWRGYSNDILRREFLPLYTLVDTWIMLCAPTFDCVFAWRREQERKLAATLAPEQAATLMDDAALRRFIQHYERFTRQCLETLPGSVHHLFQLNAAREITAYTHRPDAVAPTGYCAPQHG
jgi:D-glycerate 3-kinase